MSEYVSVALRSLAADRAGRRCEYCLLHEDDTFFPHEPDHIIAIKHGGETEADNLAWACFLCNRSKGSDLASIDPQSGAVIRLFHPRKDDWNDHFRIDEGRIDGLSPEGRATVSLLRMNLAENVKSRWILIRDGRFPPSGTDL